MNKYLIALILFTPNAGAVSKVIHLKNHKHKSVSRCIDAKTHKWIKQCR